MLRLPVAMFVERRKAVKTIRAADPPLKIKRGSIPIPSPMDLAMAAEEMEGFLRQPPRREGFLGFPDPIVWIACIRHVYPRQVGTRAVRTLGLG